MDGGPGDDYLEDNIDANTFVGGEGNDHIEAANNGVRDTIDCGPGYDRADVEPFDAVTGCEDVRR
jgi:hypothetical protein